MTIQCCGYAGLGSRMDDICGRDWVPGGGDHGDPGLVFMSILSLYLLCLSSHSYFIFCMLEQNYVDLERAISDLQREARVSIPLVVFGHMHKSLAYGRGLRKMIAFGANHTIYLNGAVVPRVKFAQTIPRFKQNQPEGSGSIAPTLRAFTIAELSEGHVEKISEVWVLVSGARTEVEEEIVLYKHPPEHM